MTIPNRTTFTALAFLLAAGPAAVAQESTGQILGSLRLKDGKAVANATIILTSPALQGQRRVATDSAGAFRAPLLPPGRYTLTASKDGFVTTRAEVELGVGQILRQDLLTAEAVAATTVEVVATASTVDKTDVKQSTAFSDDVLNTIPRTVRSLTNIALLAPGVTTGIAGRVTIRGSQTTGNRYLLNGTDIADNVFNVSGGRQYYVDDSIDQVQVLQSPVHARYGNFTGGVINAITKSGGNEFSGVLRANINRTDWSAAAPRGLRPAVAPSNSGLTNGEDILSRTYTLQVGGPIWKDRIWFNFSTKQNPQSATQGTFSAPGPTTTNSDGSPRLTLPTEGAAYTTTTDLTFYEGKLTFAITSDHTIEVGGSKQKQHTANSPFIGNSYDPDTLSDRDDTNEYRSIAYRGVLGNNLSIEARYSNKIDEILSGGKLNRPRNQRIDVLLSNLAYYRFNNATFSAVNPLERNAKTYTANVTWYSPTTAFGQHIVDVGYERVRTGQKSDNAQTPTGIRMFVSGINPDGTYRAFRSGVPSGGDNIELSLTSAAEATSVADSAWLNDVITFSPSWQVMLGLRYDKASATDTLGTKTISSNKVSPRFQVTFDPFQDQSWIFRGHAATYVGRLHDGFTTRFTYSGNPVREGYLIKTNGTAYTYDQITNLASWDISPNGFIYAAGGPTSFVDPNIKAPSATEFGLSARHNWKDGSFIEFRAARRVWKDFYNDFNVIGDEYAYNSVIVPGISVRNISTRWRTDDRVKRHYNNAEMEFLFILNPQLQFGGNYTYATLKGNGEGGDSGGANVSVTGDTLGDFDAVHQANGRDESYYAPYGFLAGDQSHKASLYLNYMNRSEKGTLFTGSLLFNYTGGGVYSLTRSTVFGSELQAAATAAGSTIASQYASFYPNYTRYFGERGLGRFNDTFNFDLKLGLEVPIWSKLRGFVELTVFNVFNHWQRATFSTSTLAGTVTTTSPLSGYRALPWGTNTTNLTGWGTYGAADYVGGRSVVLSTGFKW